MSLQVLSIGALETGCSCPAATAATISVNLGALHCGNWNCMLFNLGRDAGSFFPQQCTVRDS